MEFLILLVGIVIIVILPDLYFLELKRKEPHVYILTYVLFTLSSCVIIISLVFPYLFFFYFIRITLILSMNTNVNDLKKG